MCSEEEPMTQPMMADKAKYSYDEQKQLTITDPLTADTQIACKNLGQYRHCPIFCLIIRHLSGPTGAGL